jgi:large conductance mechanosensitive channel
MKNLWREFVTFIRRGNVLDLAVAFTVGTAFTALVRALVDNVLMPPLSLLLGLMDFANLFVVLRHGDPHGPYTTLAEANAAGALTWRFGVVINSLVSFLLMAIVVFFVVRGANRLMRKPPPPPAEPKPPTEKTCPFCKLAIPIDATRCPHCTSRLSQPTVADESA